MTSRLGQQARGVGFRFDQSLNVNDKGMGTLCVLFCAIGSAGLACAEPLSFSEEAVARGVDYRLGFNYEQLGAGNMLADLDGDGDLDIMIAGASNNQIGVFENDGSGHFTDRSLDVGMAPLGSSGGFAVADYDNDGDLDVYISGYLVPNRLYRNDGGFVFTDVASQAGLDNVTESMAASWGDYNGDGHLDLYASVRSFIEENKLYHNNGDGTFTDVAGALGVDAPGDPTLLPSFFDFDRDGDDDIYLGTDKGSDIFPPFYHNKLYRNNGDGTFYNATYDTNSMAYLFCMGIAVGDIDFDGFFDLYMTNVPAGNLLLKFNPVTGAYVDQTSLAGMESNILGWGTVFADFDNDMHLDTYVCNHNLPNRLYRGSPNWPLVDEAVTAGVGVLNDDVYSVSVGDIDGDNDLDMLVGNTNKRVSIFINDSPDASKNNWVRLNIEGTAENQYCVGACVEVKANGIRQTRQVRSGVNYKAHNEFTLNYGLADAESIEEVQAFFPGNIIRTLVNVPINSTWTIYSPDRLGDVDNDGVITTAEIFQAMGARTGPGGTMLPGNEIFDMDGDFDVDFDDIQAMGLGVFEPRAR